MAKKGKTEQNNKRIELVARYAVRRAEIKKVLNDADATPLERTEAQRALRKLPRDSSATRVRNRCQFTGRPRAFMRKFGISRIAFRQMALEGVIPGVTKSSW